MKMRKTMEYKGFNAQIMEAERLVGDHVFSLPQGRALQVYYADEFLHPPENDERALNVLARTQRFTGSVESPVL